MKEIVKILEGMKNSAVRNYAIAGLNSHLVGGEGFGKVRLFEKESHQHDSITPHSHRFDFTCLVLQGHVTNLTWYRSDELGDLYQESELTYSGEIGEHTVTRGGWHKYAFTTKTHNEGRTYSMKAEEIHSISFSKDAKVLFFEGPEKSNSSLILEPVIDNRVIPTYIKEPWMFRRN